MTVVRTAVDWTKRHRVTVSLSASFIALHAGAYTFFAGRDPYGETIFPPCLVLHYLGIQCPGCGGTRAMYSLLHGDVATSIAMNPLVIAGYLALAIALTGIVFGQRGGERISRAMYWLAASVAIGATVWSTVIRNFIPGLPV